MRAQGWGPTAEMPRDQHLSLIFFFFFFLERPELLVPGDHTSFLAFNLGNNLATTSE